MRAAILAIILIITGVALMLNMLTRGGRIAGGGLFFLGLILLALALYDILRYKR